MGSDGGLESGGKGGARGVRQESFEVDSSMVHTPGSGKHGNRWGTAKTLCAIIIKICIGRRFLQNARNRMTRLGGTASLSDMLRLELCGKEATVQRAQCRALQLSRSPGLKCSHFLQASAYGQAFKCLANRLQAGAGVRLAS